MNILHYTIGLPPTRHGGSVQYAYDLMVEQAKSHNVFALTCGDTLFREKVCKIKKKSENSYFIVYLLTNPITPTLIYGTSNPESQVRNVRIDFKNIQSFIIGNNIEIFHIHTFMGLPIEVVKYIKSLGVKIVYTSHDFNGICPHYNLIDYKGLICTQANGERCARCNINEPSDWYLRLANSSFYHKVKQSGIFNLFCKLKPKICERVAYQERTISSDLIARYDNLFEYYNDYFHLIDKFHFNSSQTREVFKKFLTFVDGDVIPVITSGIRDNRKPLKPKEVVKFGFIGSTSEYKGFPLLKKVLCDIANDGIDNFRLLVYSGRGMGVDPDCSMIEYRSSYRYSEIDSVLYDLDCIVVPSKWYETFSLVTLEALAHGRPVIVSDHVGAKDIVREYSSKYIFSSEAELKSLIRNILVDKSFLTQYNEMIVSNDWFFSINSHNNEIVSLYEALIGADK